jgi:hypothetical protein
MNGQLTDGYIRERWLPVILIGKFSCNIQFPVKQKFKNHFCYFVFICVVYLATVSSFRLCSLFVVCFCVSFSRVKSSIVVNLVCFMFTTKKYL